MRRFAPALALTVLSALPAQAAEFVPVTELPVFLDVIEGKELRIGLFGIALKVSPDGRIDGSASGQTVSGNWAWEDGYFCREMLWGDKEIPYNCQLVEVRDNAVIRFTVDRGAGDSAAFNLR
jgi:hypothetical protein